MAATIDDVHAAADKLNQDGCKPSYASIRALMGKASYSVIAEGLRCWSPKTPDPGPLEPAPPDILESAQAFGSRVWNAAWIVASKRADEKLAEMQAQLDVTRGDMQSMIASADQATSEADQWKAESGRLQATLDKCRNLLAARDKELIAVKAEAQSMRQTIDQFSQALLIKRDSPATAP